MNKYTYIRMLYPEPDESGGGGEPEVKDENESGDVNAFDFDNLTDDEGQGETETETEDDGYVLELSADLGLEEEEIRIFTDAAKKYGIDRAAASGMVSEFTAAINENVKRVQAEESAAAEKKLREEWGSSFGSNVRRAGELIRRVGQAAGWSESLMNSFKNAESIRVFHDIARVLGSGKTVGLSRTPAAAAAPMTKKDVERELRDTVSAFWNARASGNREEAMKLSDRHRELQKMLTGKAGARILLP